MPSSWSSARNWIHCGWHSANYTAVWARQFRNDGNGLCVSHRLKRTQLRTFLVVFVVLKASQAIFPKSKKKQYFQEALTEHSVVEQITCDWCVRVFRFSKKLRKNRLSTDDDVENNKIIYSCLCSHSVWLVSSFRVAVVVFVFVGWRIEHFFAVVELMLGRSSIPEIVPSLISNWKYGFNKRTRSSSSSSSFSSLLWLFGSGTMIWNPCNG